MRCLHSLPANTFVCCYTGEILLNEDAEAQGAQHGDAYLIDMDFLEVWGTTHSKLGYEEEAEVVAGGEEVEVDGEATPLIPVPWEECIFPPGYDIEELFRIIKEEDLKKEREKEKEKEKGKEKERRNEKEKEKEKEQEKEKEKEKERGKEETETKEGQSFNTRRYYGEVDPYVTNAQFFGNVGRFINVRTCPLPSISHHTTHHPHHAPPHHQHPLPPPPTTTTYSLPYYFFLAFM